MQDSAKYKNKQLYNQRRIQEKSGMEIAPPPLNTPLSITDFLSHLPRPYVHPCTRASLGIPYCPSHNHVQGVQ